MFNIIVADDSYAHRKIMVNIIREITSACIIEANNGIEVILSDLSKASLLICDIVMPQMDGLKVIHYIRNVKKIAKLPIIVISSTINSEDIKKVYAMGVSEVLKKPVEKEKLKKIIRKYI